MLSACTIIACNYYPFARVLADSFFLHHPDGSLTVLLIDDEGRCFSPEDTRIDWRRLSDLGIEQAEIHRLGGIYDVTELATAVKPRLLQQLLDEGRDHVVYLDPDIRIYDALDEVRSLARQHDIVLTPHTVKPFPRDKYRVDAYFILAAGVYNLGFIGVGSGSRPFLDWWWQTTRREALIDTTKMMFTDQRCVDFVPSFFAHYLLKDPTYNVAYWNLHARTVTWDGRRYLVDGAPLRFFHFSGFDVRKPWLLSKHQAERPRILLSEHPGLARICSEYAASILEAGFDANGQEPYGWGRNASGMPLTNRIRRLYWDGLATAEAGQSPEPPDPFDTANPTAFVDWLNSSAEGGPRGLSRFLQSIHKDRLDLQIHFPDPHGADSARYADWIWRDGLNQVEIPPELLPPRERGDALTGRVNPVGELTEGINVAGYFRAELGIGEAARLLTSAIEAAGIPHSTLTYDKTLSRQAHPFSGRPTNGPAYDVNVVCVNADSTPRFARDVGPDFFAGRHTVGYWFWEIEQFPTIMHAAFDVVDEVWAATDFIVDAVRGAGRKPVFKVPLPVSVPRYRSTITRERLGLPNRFTFLLIFDFLSVMERKNPLDLIEAFTQAFSPDEGPVLLFKTINGQLSLTELERLRAAAGKRPDILVVDAYYSAEEKNALLGLCDCYVSLHRSEGLGLTMAEAMALGKPVVATAYSGNLQFMTPDNSYLVDYVTCGIPSGCDPYPMSSVWAAPNLDQAARFMRTVYEQSAEVTAKARRGQADMLEHHSIHATVRAIAQRLEHIRRDRRGRIAMLSHETPAESQPSTINVPSAPNALETLSPHLESSTFESQPAAGDESLAVDALETRFRHLGQLANPKLSATGRTFPMVRLAFQRALFRVLRPYWFQQGQFHRELLDALRQLATGIHGEQRKRAALAARVQKLTRGLAKGIHREQRKRGALDAQVQKLTRDLLASKRELRTLGQRLLESEGKEREDGQRADDYRLNALAADIGRLTTAAATLQGVASTIETVTARLDTESAQIQAGLTSLQDEATTFKAVTASLGTKVEETHAGLTSLQDGATAFKVIASGLGTRIEEIHTRLAALQGASETFHTNASVHLQELTSVVQEVQSSVSTLTHKLFAVPYMADPNRFIDTDASGRERLGYRGSNAADAGTFYREFQNIFRGSENLIRDRQRVYMPLLESRSAVVDIGCGRGEMLDLLREARVSASGLDIDPDMVRGCRVKGHNVEQIDALTFLQDQPTGSMDAIFAAQVIEHFSFDQLREFLTLCRSRLRIGGLLITETVNPHALEAFKTFYTDLTHQCLIFPEVALALYQLSGFEQAHILFPLGSGDLDRDRQSQGEYAVVATVGVDN